MSRYIHSITNSKRIPCTFLIYCTPSYELTIEKVVTPLDTPAVGIDVGIKSMVVLSDDNEILVVGLERIHSKIKKLLRNLHLQIRAGKSGEHNKARRKG